MMAELQKQGVTIILATHDMAEAEKMSQRVAILLKGKIVATGTPREITATGEGMTKISARTENNSLADKSVVAFPAVSKQLLVEDYAVYYSTDPGPAVSAILAHIAARGDRLIDLRVERPSLEERFLEITNGGAR
jgi:ABC-2 type transport system ATP-binding protein